MRCSVCALPPVVRRECEDRLQRRGLSLRAVAAYATDLGHVINKDSLANHLRHLGPGARPGVGEPQAGGAASLVAWAARDVLAGWPRLAAKLAQRLDDDGLVQEGAIVIASLDDLEGAFAATSGTESRMLLECRVLCAALHVVMPRHPKACHEVASELVRIGAPTDLREAFEWLAEQPIASPEPRAKETSA
jgi:hypothetical protein